MLVSRGAAIGFPFIWHRAAHSGTLARYAALAMTWFDTGAYA
jgi:hypothetical protein